MFRGINRWILLSLIFTLPLGVSAQRKTVIEFETPSQGKQYTLRGDYTGLKQREDLKGIVVLLHSIGKNRRQFPSENSKDLFRRLVSKQYGVIRFDFRKHGQSSGKDFNLRKDPGFAQQDLDAIASWIERELPGSTAKSKVHWVAFGPYSSAMLASRAQRLYNTSLKSLTLVDPQFEKAPGLSLDEVLAENIEDYCFPHLIIPSADAKKDPNRGLSWNKWIIRQNELAYPYCESNPARMTKVKKNIRKGSHFYFRDPVSREIFDFIESQSD